MSQFELTKTEKNHLEAKYNDNVKKDEGDKQRVKDEYDALKREMLHAEVEAKNKLNE